MKKSMKKVLSYALGVILAMGIGLSYAYAVGANDSNAFVTWTEWNEKVAQLETSLTNISKTVKDSTLDFMMNSPRLQANLVEGFEDTGGIDAYGYPIGSSYRGGTMSGAWNRYGVYNYIYLRDQWDGTQSFKTYEYYSADTNDSEFPVRMRYALRSDEDPNIYLIFSIYSLPGGGNGSSHFRMWTVGYVDISKRQQNYSASKTVSVTLSLDEWWPAYGSSAPPAMGNTNADLYCSNVGYFFVSSILPYSNSNSATYGNYGTTISGGTASRAVDTTNKTLTYKFNYPAGACVMKQFTSGSSWVVCVLPIDMKGRKYGGPGDLISVSATANDSAGFIAKVYSPQKGCLALKSYMNGEIPIFNE